MTNIKDVYVAIPWRDGGDLSRKRNVRYIARHLKRGLRAEINYVDGTGEIFSLPAARNQACENAAKGGYKAFVVCDADTVLDIPTILESIKTTIETNRIVLPFTLFRALNIVRSRMVLNGADVHKQPDIASFDWSVGGAYVSTPEAWAAMRGQDERFTGWGCEDTAFAFAAEQLGMPCLRVEGQLNHLWHPSSLLKDEEHPAYIFNAALLQRYYHEPVDKMIEEHYSVLSNGYRRENGNT